LLKGFGDTDYSSWYLFTDTVVVLGVFVIGTRLSKASYSNLFWLSVFASFLASSLFLFFEEVLQVKKINRNDYAWDMNLLSLVMLLFSARRSQKLVAIFTTIFLLFAILLIESRKSFIFESLIVIFLCIELIRSLNGGMAYRRIMNIAVISLSVLAIILMLQLTSLGERFEGAIDLLELSPDAFDGRANFYFTAPILISINPLTGIGLRNYIVYGLNYDERLHSEILVQLLENGVVGFSLWVFFYVSSFRRTPIFFRLMLLSVFLLAFFFRWNYNHYLSFMFFGLIVSNEKYINSRF
jgi:O-antigen ligase